MRRLLAVLVILSAAFLLRSGLPVGADRAGLPTNDAHLGLIYDGLEVAPRGTPCWPGFQIPVDLGGLPMCSHGPDPIDLTVQDANFAEGRPPTSDQQIANAHPIVCERGDPGRGGHNRVLAMYVYETDEPNRFATYEASFRTWAGHIEKAVADSAALHGGERHVRWVHDGTCRLHIEVVGLPNGSLSTITAMINALDARGYDDPSEKYLVWADSSRYCGIGSLFNDDLPSTTARSNNHDGGLPTYSRTDNRCWGGWTEAHELVHSLGAVQSSAPNATMRYHCLDESDRLCYDDGWGGSGRTVEYKCPSSHERLFDCKGDDYFNPNPPLGSYLDRHFNVADSSFLFEHVNPPPPDRSGTGAVSSALGF